MRSRRLFSSVAAVALTLTAVLAAVPAGAVSTGQFRIKFLDDSGDPVAGQVLLAGATGMKGALSGSTVTFDVTPGAYGVFTLTPWGGVTCAGLTACSYDGVMAGTVVADGSLEVTDGGLTTETVNLAAPAHVVGTGLPGSPLSIQYSTSLQALYSLLDGQGGVNVRPNVQWLRDGTPIADATTASYTPVGADAGKKIAATLSYTGIGATYIQQVAGGVPPTPVTTPAMTISAFPTKAFLQVVPGKVAAGEHAVIRFDATTKGAVVLGKATVRIGKWKSTQVLRNGSMTVQSPKLPPGKYAVTATYLGSDSFSPATAKKRALTVTAK